MLKDQFLEDFVLSTERTSMYSKSSEVHHSFALACHSGRLRSGPSFSCSMLLAMQALISVWQKSCTDAQSLACSKLASLQAIAARLKIAEDLLKRKTLRRPQGGFGS